MEFSGFDWDEGNYAKCQKHGVSIREIESVFSGDVLILHDRETPEGERRFRAIGTAGSGRKVFLAFTWRGTAVRPISARYMHQREVAYYERYHQKTDPDLQDR